MAEPATVNMSASTAPHPQLEEALNPSNDAAHGLFMLAEAGRKQAALNKAALPGIRLPIKQVSELPTEGRRGNRRR